MSLEDRLVDGGSSKSSAMWSTVGEKEEISRTIEDLAESFRPGVSSVSALQAESESLSYRPKDSKSSLSPTDAYVPYHLPFDPLAERRSGPLSGPRGVIAEAQFDAFKKMKEAERQRYAARPGNSGNNSSLSTTIFTEGSRSCSLAEEIMLYRKLHPPRDDGDRDGSSGHNDDDGGDKVNRCDKTHPKHKHDSLYYHPDIDSDESDEDDSTYPSRLKSRLHIHSGGGSSDNDDIYDEEEEEERRRNFPTFFGSSSYPSTSTSTSTTMTTTSRLNRYNSSNSSRISRPKYGLHILSSSSLLPLYVDACKTPAFCLCLIWDDYAKMECRPWVSAWHFLSNSFPYTSFLMLKASDASEHWDPISIPALAVYYGGDTVAAHVRLHGAEDEGGTGLGRHPTTRDIQSWLSKHTWLS